MNSVNGGAAAYRNQERQDPRAILNACQDLNQAIDQSKQRLEELERLQKQALDDPDTSPNSQSHRRLDAVSAEIMTMYENFTQRLKKLKESPEAGLPTNHGHINLTKTKLENAIKTYQGYDRDFNAKLRAQMERQYRIVFPDAPQAEVKLAMEDPERRNVFETAVWLSQTLHSIGLNILYSLCRAIDVASRNLHYAQTKTDM